MRDIVDAIEAIEAYSVSSYEEFLADAKTQDAILYNLIIIGEAANQISDEFQERHNTIPLVVYDRYKEYHCSWLRSSQIADCVENTST
jgi:uncharacterized protein with HEPN domain